jgi:ParB-like nuclease domain
MPKYGTVPIAAIEFGERRRQDYGDIAALAAGITKVGLLHPLIVQQIGPNKFKLVVGGRRLKALQLLGWESVPIQLLETLTDEQLRDIELDENENRKDFSEKERHRTFKAAKQLVEDAKKAEAILSQVGTVSSGKRGNPKKAASVRAVASALGTTNQDISRAQKHESTAEQFPFMQGIHWSESNVIEAGKIVKTLPASERPNLNVLFDLTGPLAPAHVFPILNNIAALPATERREIYELAVSSDSRDRSLAVTKAAATPPMPDPRLSMIKEAKVLVDKAAREFSDDPWATDLRDIGKELSRVMTGIRNITTKEPTGNAVRANTRIQ